MRSAQVFHVEKVKSPCVAFGNFTRIADGSSLVLFFSEIASSIYLKWGSVGLVGVGVAVLTVSMRWLSQKCT